jgi:hypothetical protein
MVEDERLAVDGAVNGPVRSEQPDVSHPVAAEPTKVGEPDPKLDAVTPVVA